VKHSQCECLLAKASLYLLTNFTDDQADRPTLAECVRFPGRERSIVNIPQEIGTKNYEFGLFLLDDDRISAIAYKHKNDAEQINCEVLQQWIADCSKLTCHIVMCIVCHLHGSVMQSASWSLYRNGVTMFIFSTYIPVLLSCHCLIEKCITWQSFINSLLLLYSADRGVGNEQFWRTRFPDFSLNSP